MGSSMSSSEESSESTCTLWSRINHYFLPKEYNILCGQFVFGYTCLGISCLQFCVHQSNCFLLMHKSLATKFWLLCINLSASWSSFGPLLPPHAAICNSHPESVPHGSYVKPIQRSQNLVASVCISIVLWYTHGVPWHSMRTPQNNRNAYMHEEETIGLVYAL